MRYHLFLYSFEKVVKIAPSSSYGAPYTYYLRSRQFWALAISKLMVSKLENFCFTLNQLLSLILSALTASI